jgi:DNA-binding NtrC family response regulator
VSDTTTIDAAHRPRADDSRDARAFALVLAGSIAAPERVGESIVVDEAWGDASRVFGRGEARDDDGLARVFLARERPGRAASEPTRPFEDGFVSRKQLAFGWNEDGVRVENLGRLALLADGQRVTRAIVRPGETLEIDRQLVFLCVERSPALPALRESHAAHDFGEPDRFGLVGESEPAWELREQVAFVAARAGHVLLLGESGTGKELVARAIHARSSRASKRVVSRNAATLPAGLIDAELFGNVANYPNPGMAERPGLIGEADGGTLFLDEIGELPEALQAHLLRVLDEGGEYQRLGDARRRTADFRLIAATNRPLSQLKHDLAARLRLRLHLPGLSDRAEDVPLVARFLLRRAAAADPGLGARFCAGWDGKQGEPRIAIDLSRALVKQRWTTHVRELEAVLWSSLTTSKGDTAELTEEAKRTLGQEPRAGARSSAPPALRSTPPREVTAEAIRASLAKHDGVKDRVWRELGLGSRFALRRLLKKFGIEDGEAGEP